MPTSQLAPEAPASMAVVGRHYRVHDHYEVGREKIREFARAVQNDHPAHRYEADAEKLGCTAIVAPPTFASVIGMTTTQALLETVLTDYDLSQIMQIDQVFEMHRPMLAGDQLSSEAVIESVRRVRGNDFIVVKAIVTDHRGQVVVVGTTTIVARLDKVDADIVQLVEGVVMHHRAAAADPDVLSAMPAELASIVPDMAESRRGATVHTVPYFDDLTVGDQLPTDTRRLTRGDLVNYAGVSGDNNPIHYSDRAAQLAGLPTVVAHGLLTMGLLADYVTSWLDDPTAIETFSVRFAGFVPVESMTPAEIEFNGKIKALDPERRTASILLGGTTAGKKLFGRALAQVQLR